MKRANKMILVVITITYAAVAAAQDSRLNELLYSRQFTLLEKAVSSVNISKKNKLLYSAFLANAFNRPATSDSLLKKIFADKIAANDDSMQFHLNQLAYYNAVMQKNYPLAYRTSKILSDRYASFLPGTKLQGMKDESLIWNSLSAVPAQKVVKTKASVIPLKKIWQAYGTFLFSSRTHLTSLFLIQAQAYQPLPILMQKNYTLTL